MQCELQYSDFCIFYQKRRVRNFVLVATTVVTHFVESTEAATSQAHETSEVQIEEILNPSQTEELEETHQDSVVEPATTRDERLELDDVIDDLLDRDRVTHPESQIVGEIIMETGNYVSKL